MLSCWCFCHLDHVCEHQGTWTCSGAHSVYDLPHCWLVLGGGIMPVSDWPSSVLRFLCVINSLISVSCLSLTFRRLCFSARSPLARSAPGKKFKVLHLFVQSLIYWVIQIFGRDICWKEEEWESQTDSVRSPMSRKVAFMKDVVTHEHDFDSKILICRPSRCTVVKRCCGRSRRDRKCRD